jgi:hypothetical protein
MKYITSIDGHEYTIEILDEHHVIVDGKERNIDLESVGGQPIYSLLVDGESYEVHVYPADEGWQVLVHGSLYPAKVEDERENACAPPWEGACWNAVSFTSKHLCRAWSSPRECSLSSASITGPSVTITC